MIREKIGEIGLESFPDNTDVEWKVLAIEHKGDYAFVEAEATPDKVGYPRFRFVLRFDGGTAPLVAGSYCLDGGAWTLLFSDPNAPGDWRSLA